MAKANLRVQTEIQEYQMEGYEKCPDARGARPGKVIDQRRSKRSAFITLFQAKTKSRTNFSFASDWP